MSLDVSRPIHHGLVIRGQPAAKFHRQLGQYALNSRRMPECGNFAGCAAVLGVDTHKNAVKNRKNVAS